MHMWRFNIFFKNLKAVAAFSGLLFGLLQSENYKKLSENWMGEFFKHKKSCFPIRQLKR